jgi:hypothetical protein
MKAKIHTHANVGVEVWKVKRNPDGSVMRDGRGEVVLDTLVSYRWLQNTTATTMKNYKIYYIAHETATKPVNRVKFLYNSSASSAYRTVSFSNVSYATTWVSTWTNETGSTQTVDTVRLVNMSDAADVVFCTASPAQSVADHEIMRVSWTHTHTTSGTTPTTANDVLAMLRDCLTGDNTVSNPLYSMKFTGDLADTTEYLGTPFSGGSLSDTTVVWKPTAEAGSNNTVLSGYTLYLKDGTTYATKAGLSDAWVEGQEITATVTVTMT